MDALTMEEQIQQEDPFLTIKEIAEELRVHHDTILSYLENGDLHGVRIGRQWRVRKSHYEEWLARHSNWKEHPESPTEEIPEQLE